MDKKEVIKKRLSLTPIQEGLKVGIKIDGKKYSVRDDRSRYFFPEEWNKFYNSLNEKNKPIFDFLINTGARIEEALNVKPKDFDWDRKLVTLRVTKKKSKKDERMGKKRIFVVSTQFCRRMKKYITDNEISHQDALFEVTKQSVWKLMRTKLERLGFIDWWNFSLHNIRKTHGNWLKALEIPATEICLRLGHDFNTYLKHYGSATIFDRKDKIMIIKILGDVYNLK